MEEGRKEGRKMLVMYHESVCCLRISCIGYVRNDLWVFVTQAEYYDLTLIMQT